jgi:anti-sigma B factor antagonist
MSGERRTNGPVGYGSEHDIVTIVLPDRIDSATAQDVEKSMLDAIAPGDRVVVDGSAVAYMSAAGVRALATVLRRAEERQARVVFCRFAGAAEDCLIVAGFSQLLDVVGSPEDAVAKLRSKSGGNAAERLHPYGATG